MNSVLIISLAAAAGYAAGHQRITRLMAGGTGTLRAQPRFHAAFVAACAALPAIIIAIGWMAFGTDIILADAAHTLRTGADTGMDTGMDTGTAIAPWAAGIPTPELLLYLGDAARYNDGGLLARPITPQLQQTAALLDTVQTKWATLFAIITMIAASTGLYFARRKITPAFAARDAVEKIIYAFLIACASVAVLTTFGIVMSLIFETLRFFEKVPVSEFLFGLQWSPQTALRADQVASSGAFGAVPLFAGTLLITFIAMVIAAPVGLFSAIYLSEFASNRTRAIAKPLLEILAGIPTVVYGFFAALTIAPMMQDIGEMLGISVAAGSALAAGAVMGMMIVPLVSSLSDDVINAVPQSLRDGSLALGSTPAETIRQVVLPAALPGVVGALLLAMSRAIGETMIVVMAAGLAANLTMNPLEMVTTVTVQIVTLLVGDQEFDSAKTLAAFALGLVLFVITLCLNIIALRIVHKYREQYD